MKETKKVRIKDRWDCRNCGHSNKPDAGECAECGMDWGYAPDVSLIETFVPPWVRPG